MALRREFFESECGQQNPVLKVATHFTQDRTLRESVPLSGPSGAAHYGPESFLQQYSDMDQARQEMAMLPPTSFQMDSLLKEIQHLEGPSAGPIVRPVPGPSVADYAKHPDWAKEFVKNERSLKVSGAAWAGEYFDAELDSAWDDTRERYYPHPARMGMDSRLLPPPGHHSMAHGAASLTARELLDDSKWADDFVDTISSGDRTELMNAAGDLISTVKDPNMQATEFMKFVEKLSNGEVDFDKEATLSGSEQATGDDWAAEYDTQQAKGRSWAEEFALQENVGDRPSDLQDGKEEFWKNLQEEWDRLAQEDSSSHPWLTEQSGTLEQPYVFKEDNPFQQTDDPLAEGKRKLLRGDIPSAVLLFEAAVNKFPENPECWLLLGTTQALNEQDPLAISALNKCLSMDPHNLDALMALAASLTNESHHLQAANALKRWLKYNPKYHDIVNEDVQALDPKMTTILPTEELTKIQQWYMQAARINPTTVVDPDVQSGLGILFNLGTEFDKAADCFQAALAANPEDALLWNRLGATLANGGRSAEAIGAYRKSLELSPGCIRTRYNLGISCVNLGAYREAAEHFLSSLNIQAAGRAGDQTENSSNANVMSESIWSSLRMIIHLLDRSDLRPLLDAKDLNRLNEEFQVQA